jgi:hypothetical protein
MATSVVDFANTAPVAAILNPKPMQDHRHG